MKIKMRRLAAGPEGVFRAGTVAEVSNDFAKQLMGGGYAVAYDKPVERTGQPLGRAVQSVKGSK